MIFETDKHLKKQCNFFKVFALKGFGLSATESIGHGVDAIKLFTIVISENS